MQGRINRNQPKNLEIISRFYIIEKEDTRSLTACYFLICKKKIDPRQRPFDSIDEAHQIDVPHVAVTCIVAGCRDESTLYLIAALSRIHHLIDHRRGYTKSPNMEPRICSRDENGNSGRTNHAYHIFRFLKKLHAQCLLASIPGSSKVGTGYCTYKNTTKPVSGSSLALRGFQEILRTFAGDDSLQLFSRSVSSLKDHRSMTVQIIISPSNCSIEGVD